MRRPVKKREHKAMQLVKKGKRGFLFFLVLLSGTFSQVKAQTGNTGGKQLHLWYIVDPTTSFGKIMPVKNLIASLSVFGKLSRGFIDSCHLYNIELYYAVSDREDAINSAEKTDAIVKKYLEQCEQNGYDGIDLDYEGLSVAAQPFYIAFLQKLSGALHAKGKKLSHCVGYYPTFVEKGPDSFFYTPKVISETCDLVRVMCYDMYYAPGKNDSKLMNRMDCQGIGPTSNYPWTREAMSFWLKFVKPANLVMCLPAYSNDYAFGSKVTGDQVYKPYPNVKPAKVSDTTWLWYEKLTVYNYVDSLKRKHLFYASDAKSTAALLSISKQLGIPNVGFWHFSSIDDGTWKVVADWLKD